MTRILVSNTLSPGGFNVRPMNQKFTTDGYCLVFNRAARAISRLYNRHLVCASLTVGQYCILDTVLKTGPITLRDLGDALVIERSALLRALKPLSTAALLQSSADPSNRRRILVGITLSGEDRLRLAVSGIRACPRSSHFQFAHAALLFPVLQPAALCWSTEQRSRGDKVLRLL
jgi:DNA-binding MarR family transcriptional regulator